MANFFLDPVGGNDALDGTTFANRWKTFASGATAARIAPGDIIRIIASRASGALSMQGTFTNGTRTMVLASAANINVDLCETAWTAAANVTAATSATCKEGAASVSLVIAAGFTTGIIAYKALGAATDFSTMRQLCAWIQSNTALAGGVLRFDLCSDALGATPVDSFTITDAINPANVWHSFVKDKGSALGAAIQSVAIFAISDPGAITLLIDDVFTAKEETHADCITLHTGFSPSSAPAGIAKGAGWYKVMSVNGTTIAWDNHYDSSPSAPRTYDGSTATAAVYVRQGMVGTMVVASGTVINQVMDSGAQGSRITFSGGWNTTDMSTQTGETWMVYPNSQGTFLSMNAQSYVAVEKFSCLNSYVGMLLTGNHHRFTDMWILGSRTYPIDATDLNGSDNFFTRVFCWHVANGPRFHLTNQVHFTDSSVCGIVNSNATFCNRGTFFRGCAFRNAAGKHLAFYSTHADTPQLDSCATSGSGSGALDLSFDTDVGTILLRNCLIEDGTEATFYSTGSGSTQALISQDHDQVAGAWLYLTNAFRAESEATVRHTASGLAAKLSPISVALCDADQPGKLQIATIYCNAGSLVTVKAWFRRNSVSLTMKLVCPVQGSQITAEASASMTAAIDTWEELTITFTPAVAGVVEIFAHAYGGSTLIGYVDDVTRSQA